MAAEKVNLVSLGDSIATGTLTPFSRTYSYVFYLQRKFREQGYQPNIYSLAHDGDTSQDLLWKLNHSPQFRKIVEKADFITISIGGNDLLRASSIPGFASINVRMAEHGTKNFVRNWPQIIEKVRSINQAARIVVLSLYNPYNHTRHDRWLHELTEQFLAQINGAIWDCSGEFYSIADTYSAFKEYANGKMHRVTCLYPESALRNPHPTPNGQRLIADLVFERFDLYALQRCNLPI